MFSAEGNLLRIFPRIQAAQGNRVSLWKGTGERLCKETADVIFLQPFHFPLPQLLRPYPIQSPCRDLCRGSYFSAEPACLIASHEQPSGTELGRNRCTGHYVCSELSIRYQNFKEKLQEKDISSKASLSSNKSFRCLPS